MHILPIAVVAALSATPAHAAASDDFLRAPTLLAQDLDINEVRIGPAFSNLELNAQALPSSGSFSDARLDSLQLDLFFGSPDIDLFRAIGAPRFQLGTEFNFAGHENLVHADLDWHVPVFDTPFYLEAGVGLGIHDGYLDNAPPGDHDLGCRTLIHYSYGAGVNLNDHVTLTAQWQHMSDMFSCQPNQGLNQLGFVVGWKF